MKNKLKSLQNKLYITLLKIESIHEVIKELSLSTDSLEKFKIARQALTEFKNILDDELFTPNNIFDKPIKSELNCDVKTESKHLPSIDNDSADDCKNIFAKYEIEDIVVKSEDNFNYNEDLATNPNYNVVNKVEHNDGSDDENSDGELQGEAPDRKKKDKIQCTGCKFLFLKRNYEAHHLRCRNGGPVQCRDV